MQSQGVHSCDQWVAPLTSLALDHHSQDQGVLELGQRVQQLDQGATKSSTQTHLHYRKKIQRTSRDSRIEGAVGSTESPDSSSTSLTEKADNSNYKSPRGATKPDSAVAPMHVFLKELESQPPPTRQEKAPPVDPFMPRSRRQVVSSSRFQAHDATRNRISL